MITKLFKTFILILCTIFANATFGASYAYWLNGWRKNPTDDSANILVLESAKYVFALDIANLNFAYFAPAKKGFKYGEYGLDFKEFSALKKSPLELSISVGKETYFAKNARSARKLNDKPLQDVLLWESGRNCQHFELKDVEFFSKSGELLPIYADLEIVGLPDKIALSLKLKNTEVLGDCAVDGIVNTGYSIKDNIITFSKNVQKSSDEFTASLWVNLTEKFLMPSNKRGLVLLKGSQQSSEGAWGIKVDDIYCFSAFAKSGENYETSAFSAKRGWNFLAMTYADNTLKFYANGKLVGKQVTLKKPLSFKESALSLAGRSDGKGGVYSMIADELCVFDKAFSDKEIKEMYKNPEQKILDKNLVFKEDFEKEKIKDKKYSKLEDLKINIALSSYEVSKILEGEFAKDDAFVLTLAMPENSVEKASEIAKIAFAKDGKSIDVVFDEVKQCFVAKVPKIKRADDFTHSANYDDFSLSVKSESLVPFLLDMRGVASVTGICPLLCNKDGSPTGISVQVSKNWHERNMGSYLMAYAMIPEGEYILRIVYGFYGDYPSASHANLSLVGYGGSGRWEQLAIGAWGETICFDADNSLVPNMITDIRMLMAREGKDGRMWGWTNAGWGGDWLNISTKQGRLMPVGLKTSYLSQGTCLTDVRYEGYLGADREISMKAKVQTLRTNDYARTFQKLEYKFNSDFSAESFSMYFLKNLSTDIAVGDKTGLLRQADFSDKKADGVFSLDKAKYPIFFSAMGKEAPSKKPKPSGYKALALRAFEAKIAGKTYRVPEFVYDEKTKSVNMLLPRQKKKLSFKKGDSISFDIELFTLHAYADDYYGDNAEYRAHLEANPMSYKTAQREALGNDLRVKVKGGELLRAYPIEILATSEEIEIEIEGGVGIVPLKVENLAKNDYFLYEVLGDSMLSKVGKDSPRNDYYQLNYEEVENSYTYVFNLPLNLAKTKWVLKR